MFLQHDQWLGHNLHIPAKLSAGGVSGPGGALWSGFAFGIPPVVNYGCYELQETFLPDLLNGCKRCCIAITEPDAGSDVANISNTATRSTDGHHWIINGTKKWYASKWDVELNSRYRILSVYQGYQTVFGQTIAQWQSALVARVQLVFH